MSRHLPVPDRKLDQRSIRLVGHSGVAGDGTKIVCENNDGWR
jgi:hypothetical protein